MCKTSEDVQYERGISLVRVRMCSTSEAHLQYKRRCAVRIRHVFSTSENVQYESGTSSVPARMCSTSKVGYQVLVWGGGGGQGNTSYSKILYNE